MQFFVVIVTNWLADPLEPRRNMSVNDSHGSTMDGLPTANRHDGAAFPL